METVGSVGLTSMRAGTNVQGGTPILRTTFQMTRDGSRIQQVFLDYCAEANIDFQGTYYEPPIRRRMV